MGIIQPKKDEVARWMIYIMSLAIVALSGALVGMYYDNKAERAESDAAHAIEIAFFRAQNKEFQADAKAADRAFSKYLLWQDSIVRAQARQIERIKKGK